MKISVYTKQVKCFSNMVGCPLNGNWCIEVQDLWTNDNGYIHEWEMALDPHLLPQNWSYTVLVDTTFLTGPNTNGMVISPETDGVHQYTVNVVDEYGCLYDTITTLTVVPTPMPDLGPDTSICEGEILTLSAHYDKPNTIYHWNTGANTENIQAVTQGQYYVHITTLNDTANVSCQGSDTVYLKINPVPLADFITSDTAGIISSLMEIKEMLLKIKKELD